MVQNKMNVEVCYITPQKQWLIPLVISQNTPVIVALEQSGILSEVGDLNLKDNVGIFSKKVSLEHILKEGDRIEIYRPLLLTPNELRLRRK